jgi:hypothetical protein
MNANQSCRQNYWFHLCGDGCYFRPDSLLAYRTSIRGSTAGRLETRGYERFAQAVTC